MKEARAIRRQFDSMDEMLKDLDGEAAEKAESEARRPA
jgi:DNA-damage-inducible protein J